MYLAGDIGGTKTRLALYREKGDFQNVKEKRYISHEFKALVDIVKDFLVDSEKVQSACFGVAGPVKNNKCQATNLPWYIDGSRISSIASIPKVTLINDLEATGYGIRCLKDDEIYVLNKGKREETANQALIAAGTGLGEAGLIFDGKDHRPMPSEGGHVDFGPRNEEEIELLRYLSKKFGHVSYERIVSGPGMYELYSFLTQTEREEKVKEIEDKIKIKEDPAKLISQMGLERKEKTCIRALDLFISIYGSEAGNIALKFMALGGMYVGGGIAPKILPALIKGEFMHAFTLKGRFAALLSDISVKVILNTQTALLGAAYFAMYG